MTVAAWIKVTASDLEGKTNVNDGKWHYVAGVFDGSKKYLYVDGKLDTVVNVTGEVRIWNVARTQAEILDNTNNVLSGHETGLVGYYKFDMPSGTWLYDHTGNGNTGRLHNMSNSDWVTSGWPVFYAHAFPPQGTGTASDPYRINTLDNLYWVSQNDSTWDKYFIQTADIEASSTRKWKNGTGFPPIGNSSKNFTGHYNGQGYSIDSLFINQSSNNGQDENIGLFGWTSNALIQQLVLTHENIKAYMNIGGIIGNANQTSLFYCHTDGVITGSKTGGLIGSGNQVTIQNCYSSDTVHAYYHGGGLVGDLQNSTINQSYSSGDIIGYTLNAISAPSELGGLVGYAYSTSKIINCYSNGLILIIVIL